MSKNDRERHGHVLRVLDFATRHVQGLFCAQWAKNHGGREWAGQSDGIALKECAGLRRLKNKQSSLVAAGQVVDWDFTLAAQCLKAADRPKSWGKWLDKLLNIRNSVAHASLHALNEQKATEYLEALEEALLKLEADEAALALVLGERGEYHESPAMARAMSDVADKEGSDEEKALTRALEAGGLTLQERAKLYALRARCRAVIMPESLESAKNDAKQAVYLDSSSAAAYVALSYVRLGQKKYSKAEEAASNALALHPGLQTAESALAHARAKKGERERGEDSRFGVPAAGALPNMPESAQQGYRKILEKMDPTMKDLALGHDYRDGKVPGGVSTDKAIHYYRKAADAGNAEAMYNLATLLKRQTRTRVDIEEVVELLKRAASCSPQVSMGGTMIPRVGVAHAMHSLGLMYAEGIGVQRSEAVAKVWYRKAVALEYPESANNLANMLCAEVPVNRDEVKDLFMKAHRWGDRNAAFNLSRLYSRWHQSEEALEWHVAAVTIGHERAIKEDSIFRLAVAQMQKSSDAAQSDPRATPILDLHSFMMERLASARGSTAEANVGFLQGPEIEDTVRRAEQGSVTAQRILDLWSRRFRLFDKDEHGMLDASDLVEYETTLGSDGFRAHDTAALQTRMLVLAHEAIRSGRRDEVGAAAYAVIGLLGANDPPSVLQTAREGLRRFPHSVCVRRALFGLLMFTKNFEEALPLISDLERDLPGEPWFKYDLAVALKLRGTNIDAAICAYERFLVVAPKDHRKVPEAHYALGFLRLSRGHVTPQHMRESLEAGLAAEKVRLAIYVGDEAPSKSTLTQFLRTFEGVTSTVPPQASVQPRDTVPRRHGDAKMIREWREWCAQHYRENQNIASDMIHVTSTASLGFDQRSADQRMPLRSGSFRELNFARDRVYDDLYIECIVFDGPLRLTSLMFLAMDLKGDVRKVALYGSGIPKCKVGTRLRLLRPLARRAMDGKEMVRLDDPLCVIELDNPVEDMCTCCGRAGATNLCGRCRVARYCDRKCQTEDWKTMGHKHLCDILKEAQ